MRAPSPLSARLQVVADAVLPGLPAADIGTDHGLLLLALLASGRCPNVVGIDRRPQPLERARALLRAWELAPRASLRLGNGLEPLACNEVATVVVAGMGAPNLLACLRAATPLALGVRRLVLQPTRSADVIAHALPSLGWQLVEAYDCVQRGRLYETLVAEPIASY